MADIKNQGGLDEVALAGHDKEDLGGTGSRKTMATGGGAPGVGARRAEPGSGSLATKSISATEAAASGRPARPVRVATDAPEAARDG